LKTEQNNRENQMKQRLYLKGQDKWQTSSKTDKEKQRE
jgi:hypothetical protein